MQSLARSRSNLPSPTPSPRQPNAFCLRGEKSLHVLQRTKTYNHFIPMERILYYAARRSPPSSDSYFILCFTLYYAARRSPPSSHCCTCRLPYTRACSAAQSPMRWARRPLTLCPPFSCGSTAMDAPSRRTRSFILYSCSLYSKFEVL